MRLRPKRFQAGGVSGSQYFSWTPAQQQAYGNGASVDQVNAMSPATTIQNGVATTPVAPVNPNSLTPAQVAANILSSSATAPYPTTGGSYSYNPMAPPSQNAAPPAGYTAVPFGTGTGAGGTSVVPTADTYAQMFQQMNSSPFMTQAALQNEYAVGNAGSPMAGQNVTINGQSVPWNSMTPEQQYVYGALSATGQKIPDNFMTTYQGPNAAWNNPSLNTIGLPSGSSIVNGALVNSSGNFVYPGSSAGISAGPSAAVSRSPSTGTGGTGGIASPGAFTASAPGAGVGTGMGAAGTPSATPAQTTGQEPMGTSGGLGYRRGGLAERRAPMRIRPRRFQMGGVNPAGGAGGAGGGMNPFLMALLQQQQGAGQAPPQTPPGAGPAGMGAMAGALPGGPGAAALGAMAGASHPGMPPGASPGAGSAGMGAMAGASPGGPGAAAMGAMAGAAPGTGMPGGAGAGVPGIGAPAQSPNQQWGQLLLSGAPNTGLGNQMSQMNPQMQQALYRAYLSRLGAGGTGGGTGMGAGMARGGSIPHESIGHLSPEHMDHASYRYPLESDIFASMPEHTTPAAHPDRQWGQVAEPAVRRARGGRIPASPTFNSVKPAPGNLATSAAGKKMAKGGGVPSFDSTKGAPENLPTSAAGKKMARGGRTVLRRRPPAPPKERQARNLAPPPVPQDMDHSTFAAQVQPPAPTTPAPSVPPPPGAPFAKGGRMHRFEGKQAKIPKKAEGGKWIQGAIKHPGALHEQLGVPQGEKIPAAKLAKAAKAPGKLGRRARLAETLKGMRKALGGAIKLAAGGAHEAVPMKRGAVRTSSVPMQAAKTVPMKRDTLHRAGGGKIVPVKRGAIHDELSRRRETRLARGGKLCPTCGKAHGGQCKMAAGGAAKERRGFPNTIAPPRPQKLANGGKIRGSGAAVRGTRFSGIY